MKYAQWFAAALVLTCATQPSGFAQAPDPSGGTAAPNTPAALAAELHPPRRRSIVHHYPYPYPGYYHGDQSAGFRNPGGVGRYLEYYPAGNKLQQGGVDPVKTARFDQGGGAPDRAEQIAAQQVGIRKENAIMNHIDNYARPSYGYGFGAGYFGGFY